MEEEKPIVIQATKGSKEAEVTVIIISEWSNEVQVWELETVRLDNRQGSAKVNELSILRREGEFTCLDVLRQSRR